MTADPALLARILNRPEFVWARLVESALDWLASGLVLSFDEGGIVPWIAIGLLALLLATGLVLTLRWRRLYRRRGAAPRQQTADAPPAPAALEADAEARAAAGDWSGAIRLLFRAFVLYVDDIGVLAHDPARTNRELRMRLQLHSDLEPSLGRLIYCAEAVTYAGATGSDSLWHDAAAAYRQLRQQLTQARGQAPNRFAAPEHAPGTDRDQEAGSP